MFQVGDIGLAQAFLNSAKDVFMDRSAMLAHAVALQTWHVHSVPSLDRFPLEELKAVQAEEVAFAAQAVWKDAAKDLAVALEKRAKQASACHGGAPSSTAGVTAALQASEGQPLSPAARWLSACLPAGCPLVFGRQRSSDMRCILHRHQCVC